MKNNLSIMLLLFAFLSNSCAQKEIFTDVTLQSKLTTLEGKEVVFSNILEQYKGKTLVIEIWASWCSDCVKAIPKLKELQANNPSVSYLFISMDKELQKWKDGIIKHEIQGDHLWVNDPKLTKGSFGKSLDVDWIPRYIVVDKNQKIVTYRAIETDFEQLNSTLKNLK